MKVAHIVPTKLLPLTRFNDYHMLLPQLLLRDPAYGKFWNTDADVSVGGHRILDNGAAEGEFIDWETLIALSDMYGIDEIVAPDELAHCDQTIEWCRQFEPLAKRFPDKKFIGVVQGKSLAEILKCLTYYEYTDWISSIALPRVLSNNIFDDVRVWFAVSYAERIIARWGEGSIHALGSSKWMMEPTVLSAHPKLFRGIDTSLCSVMGLAKRLIDKDTYSGRQANFFNAEPTARQEAYIISNMRTYDEWAKIAS